MKLQRIYEASSTSSGMKSVISYLQNRLGVSLVKLLGAEKFKNSVESGVGIRYLEAGTTKCIRFNWASPSKLGNIASIHSIDIFSGNSKDPSFNIKTDGVPLVKALPTLVKIIKSPAIGSTPVFSIEPALSESITESVDKSAMQIVAELMGRFGKGEVISRQNFIDDYHALHVGIFDHIVKDFRSEFDKLSNGYELIYPKHANQIKDKVLGEAGSVVVTRGGSSESYPDDEQAATTISYSDSLDHLDSLVKALIKGSYNALFVTGKGGTGKTQTVEKALHDEGLSDGDGYVKVTGSASAPGMYSMLYHNRHSIILFDDSDGALADVDARNIIKAATDTKKERKISWGKKSSFIFNPDSPDATKHFNDADMAPSEFMFYGRIIFISNLSLDKLDPDGSLRTRSFIVNINPSDDELLSHMTNILHDIKLEPGLSLTTNEREHVLDVVKNSKKGGLSIRKLVRALNLCASGERNWVRLVQLYA